MKLIDKLLIGGEWVDGSEHLVVMDPYRGEVLGRVAQAGPAAIERAIHAAEQAAPRMRELPTHQRSAILSKTATLIAEQRGEAAEIIVREAGKPWKQAVAEVERAVQTFQTAAEEAKRIRGETFAADAAPAGEGKRAFFMRQPIGVIGAITPFNFPLNLVAHKLAPALAAGNAVVLKPASATPFSALNLGAILIEASLPAGALNVLVGPGSVVGGALLSDRRIGMITFTGSAEVGQEIKSRSGLKKVTLELGSNSGVIIAEDADWELVLNKCAIAGFAYAGQSCIHTQRIYVHKNIQEAFTKEYIKRVRQLKVGDPLDKTCDVGPMIDEAAARRAEAWIKEAIDQGARLLLGGRRKDNLLEPTVLDHVTAQMKVVCEEVFAPIVVIDSFDNFEEAIGKFNQGSRQGRYSYGLSAGVFTRDLQKAWQALERLEVGNVHINETATFRVDHMPYGGVRDSGIGREGPRFAIEEMTEIKMVSFSFPKGV